MPSIHLRVRMALGVIASSVVACSAPVVSSSPAVAKTSATARADSLPNDIRWFRRSAEYRALTRQAYGVAGEKLPELSRGLAAGTWGVIMDADETVLDNSEYQRRLFVRDTVYSEATWAQWVRERAATAIPGAPEFTQRVHALGGRVVIVTNRAESLCGPTRENLQSARIATDLVLCQPPGPGDKNPRFQAVQNGTASPNFPKLTIVAWFGDNIQDFPLLTQAMRNDPRVLAEFGRRYFILPNPMYGSWQQLREP